MKEKITEKLEGMLKDSREHGFDTILAVAIDSKESLVTQIMLAENVGYFETCFKCLFYSLFKNCNNQQEIAYWLQDILNDIKKEYNLE